MIRFPLVAIFILLTTLSCSIVLPGGDSEDPTPTPPLDQVVSYWVPVYSANLSPGESVKGTQLTYVNRDGDVYQVTIDGLAATKRVGDSFNWRGVLAPGVIGNYNLRVSPTILGNNLLTAGQVRLFILNPIAVELANDFQVNQSILRFSNIGVDYKIPLGGQVPGTSLTYTGFDDQGAELSGTSGYPFRSVGDSLFWTGRLRGNVVIRNSLRVVAISDEELHLLGTAELWITPS
jgi:hypothetical protein